MIVVIDSNIWISLAINKQLDLIATFQKNEIKIVSCKELTDELTDVLSRPKFKKYFTVGFQEKFIKFHHLTTYKVELKNIDFVVSDPKDDYLFALCELTNADYFITGDKLLLAVKNIKIHQ